MKKLLTVALMAGKKWASAYFSKPSLDVGFADECAHGIYKGVLSRSESDDPLF